VVIHNDRELEWAGYSTRVVVGSGVLPQLSACCRDVGGFSRALVVTDAQLAESYAAPVVTALESHGMPAGLAVVPPGDASKSLDQASRLYNHLAKLGVGRDGVVVGVGGGMVTDLAGFVGATWMRGVTTALCPTSLEADIDASIGGKTGVNHSAGKNLIGAFHHPRVVVIDTDCLTTLPDRDLSAGLAESVKHAAISDEPFLAWHEAHAAEILEHDRPCLGELIDRNITIKAHIVARDEREEGGIRALLNFGHTIGHAIEAVCDYRLRHGESVALGMVAECRLASSLGILEPACTSRLSALLEKLHLPTRLHESLDLEAVSAYLRLDKKAVSGTPRFALLKGFGAPVVQSDVPAELIRKAVESILPR
jgi:3-dehydroquinate synthase